MRIPLSSVSIARVLVGAAIVVAGAMPLATQPQDTMTRSRQLQTRVWVNLDAKRYHCPTSRFFGKTLEGEFMIEAQARARGYRAAGARGCREGPSNSRAPLPAVDSTKAHFVWVNTASGIYHCRDAPEYGRTRSGRYLSEVAARGKGHRPAGGRACG